MIDPPVPAPFRWQDGHLMLRAPGGCALFTTRRGGVSEGPYASLNLRLRTADDPARVAEERRRLGVGGGERPLRPGAVRRADAAAGPPGPRRRRRGGGRPGRGGRRSGR